MTWIIDFPQKHSDVFVLFIRNRTNSFNFDNIDTKSNENK